MLTLWLASLQFVTVEAENFDFEVSFRFLIPTCELKLKGGGLGAVSFKRLLWRRRNSFQQFRIAAHEFSADLRSTLVESQNFRMSHLSSLQMILAQDECADVFATGDPRPLVHLFEAILCVDFRVLSCSNSKLNEQDRLCQTVQPLGQLQACLKASTASMVMKSVSL